MAELIVSGFDGISPSSPRCTDEAAGGRRANCAKSVPKQTALAIGVGSVTARIERRTAAAALRAPPQLDAARARNLRCAVEKVPRGGEGARRNSAVAQASGIGHDRRSPGQFEVSHERQRLDAGSARIPSTTKRPEGRPGTDWTEGRRRRVCSPYSESSSTIVWNAYPACQRTLEWWQGEPGRLPRLVLGVSPL